MILPYESHTFIVHSTNQHTPLLIIVTIVNMVGTSIDFGPI
jgi:hypothetical protein